MQSEEDRDDWTIKIPMESKAAGAGERKISMAIAKVRNHEEIGGYELISLEAIIPAGRDLELTEKKSKESRSGKLWYVAEPPK